MSDAEEKAALEHSTARLYWHVGNKGFQAGALVGGGVVVPVVALRRRRRRMQAANAAFLPTALRTVGRSATYGTIGTCAEQLEQFILMLRLVTSGHTCCRCQSHPPLCVELLEQVLRRQP